MYLYDEPSTQWIAGYLDAQRDAPFSYDEVGASREAVKELAGYAVDHNRAMLGEGRGTLGRAVAALHAWKMFDIGWARLVPEDAPVEVGTTVAVLARHYGFLSLNPCGAASPTGLCPSMARGALQCEVVAADHTRGLTPLPSSSIS